MYSGGGGGGGGDFDSSFYSEIVMLWRFFEYIFLSCI